MYSGTLDLKLLWQCNREASERVPELVARAADCYERDSTYLCRGPGPPEPEVLSLRSQLELLQRATYRVSLEDDTVDRPLEEGVDLERFAQCEARVLAALGRLAAARQETIRREEHYRRLGHQRQLEVPMMCRWDSSKAIIYIVCVPCTEMRGPLFPLRQGVNWSKRLHITVAVTLDADRAWDHLHDLRVLPGVDWPAQAGRKKGQSVIVTIPDVLKGPLEPSRA